MHTLPGQIVWCLLLQLTIMLEIKYKFPLFKPLCFQIMEYIKYKTVLIPYPRWALYFYIAQTMYKLLRHWFCNIHFGLSIYHQSLKIPKKKFGTVCTVYICTVYSLQLYIWKVNTNTNMSFKIYIKPILCISIFIQKQHQYQYINIKLMLT